MSTVAANWHDGVRSYKLNGTFKRLLQNLTYAARVGGAIEPTAVCYILVGDKPTMDQCNNDVIDESFDEYAINVNGMWLKVSSEEQKDDDNGVA